MKKDSDKNQHRIRIKTQNEFCLYFKKKKLFGGKCIIACIMFSFYGNVCILLSVFIVAMSDIVILEFEANDTIGYQ